MHRSRVAPLRRPKRSSSPQPAAPIPVFSDPLETSHSSASPSTSARPLQVVDRPRISAAGKGGCWTCRLRRKKCDEQRQGDSCSTCLRLSIKCLGWGARRPDWMRDKQAVDSYKAGIKAQLSRAGLIRGQPRCSFVCPPPDSLISIRQPSPPPSHSVSMPGPSTPPSNSFDVPERPLTYLDPHHRNRHVDDRVHPIMSSSPSFQMPDYQDSAFYPISVQNQLLYYPPSATPSSEPLVHNISLFEPPRDTEFSNYELGRSSPSLSSLLSSQSSVQEHIIYYFEHVRGAHFIFAGNTFTNATYSAIAQKNSGAVTNAVCALASLHFSRTCASDNIDPHDFNLENSFAMRFHEEACRLLENTRCNRPLSEADALAAFHLVGYSQLSGGVIPWQPAFQVMSDWLATTGLLNNDRPALCFCSLTSTEQFLVNATLWLDTFASIVHAEARPPKYIGLLKSLVAGDCWTHIFGVEKLPGLGMDLVSGCPDAVMLALAEIAILACWKATEQRKNTLSYRELVRRGSMIEDRLFRNRTHTHCTDENNLDLTRLNPGTPGTADELGRSIPHDDSRTFAARLFHEAAVLLLNIVLNNANPGVPEIYDSVNRITQLLKQSTASEVDRALVFPIFLAGILSDDGTHRDLCLARLGKLDRTVGNVAQIQSAMEMVWQNRGVSSAAVDFEESLSEQNLNLLLI